MTWNPAEPAHACLCFFEKWHQDQRGVQFTPAGEWMTDFLIKSAAGESQQLRDSKAMAHATLLNEVFVNLFRVTYEDGFTQDTAIQQMGDVLKINSNKMKDLGDPVDAAYRFRDELP